MNKRLPTFFIVGAQKAGTTSIHDWLVQQPDVCLPTVKETHFFSHEQRYALGMDWYMRQFPACAADAVVGEVDPEYIFHDAAPGRIRRWIEAPRLVFILRNPLDRAYSHYLMSVRRGYEKLGFEGALLAESKRLSARDNAFALDHHSYMARGSYSAQIARYKEVFPGADHLVVRFEEMVGKETGDAVYERICAFIGVKSSPSIADSSSRSNAASTARSFVLRDLLYRSSLPKKVLKALIPSHDVRMRLWILADRINRKPVEKGDGPGEIIVPASVLAGLADEVSRLERVTGMDFSGWIRNAEDSGRYIFNDAGPGAGPGAGAGA
ncbi:MAG: sulfotransferase, partial [Thermodesulfobacteriota bacterium]